MAYKALYRTYRPQSFEEVVGQETIVKTLQNSILNNKIGHAYLFCGPRGTGKTSIARIFAKTLNCPNAKDAHPCNNCSICNEITSGTSPDVIEIDAASNNGVDEIRELRDKVKFLPAGTKYKVYIIDEVHMLSTSAFNALLKTLEEPPAHAIFILATTEPNKVIPTIISRCQRFDFKSLTNDEIYKRLELVCNNEGIKFEEDALMSIAKAADGGMRDGLSLLDQAISLSDEVINDDVASNVTGTVDKSNLLKLAKSIEDKKISDALNQVSVLQNNGRDTQKITNGLLGFYRDILMCKAGVDKEDDPRYREFADNVDLRKVYFYIDALNEVQSKISVTTTANIYLEVGLIKMISASSEELDYGKRILDLEQRMENYTPGEGGGSVDADTNKRIRLLEEKLSNLLSELSKMELHKVNDRIKVLEDKNNSETSTISEENIKELNNRINLIVEDLELLKVTQDSLRAQVDNVETGGIDDDILTERIETNLKKIKPVINYSEIETYVNKKMEEFSERNSTYVQTSNYNENSEIVDYTEKFDEINNELNYLKEALQNMPKGSTEVVTKEFVTYDDHKLNEIETRINDLLSSQKQNPVEVKDNTYEFEALAKRIDELEEIILSGDEKKQQATTYTEVLPNNIEERISKMESNIYKIMSGMLNPQPSKKAKNKVDNKQISLWSDDIVDFGRIEKPTDNNKTDFEEFAKTTSVENEPESFVEESIIEPVDDTNNQHEDIELELVEESKEEIEETSEEGNQYVSDEIDNENPKLEEESEEQDKEETNLFTFDEESVNETSSVVKETSEEYTPLFEENLIDFYSESNEENDEDVADNNETNLFNESSSEDLEINEAYEGDEEPSLEEQLKQEEERKLEEERKAQEREVEVQRLEEERKAQEDRLYAEQRERERFQAQEEMERKRLEVQKIEESRAEGGEDLDEYERYDVKVLERILSDERNPEFYDEKGRIERVWRELLRLAPADKRGTAEILAEGKVQSVGNHEFVLIFNNAILCNQVMSRRFKKVALKLLYDILGTDYNYFAITQEVWLEKRSEYAGQYAMGTKYPTLSPISDPSFRVVVDNDDSDSESMIRKSMNIFGDKLNVK